MPTLTAPRKLKMDEATILEGLVKYTKQLQAKVKTLEAQLLKTTMNHDSGSCSTDKNCNNDPRAVPQIEARVLDRHVRVRIQCVRCQGVLLHALKEIDKLNLCVVGSSAIPFGTSLLDITIVAQMDVDFIIPVEELVECLRSTLIQCITENIPQEPEN